MAKNKVKIVELGVSGFPLLQIEQSGEVGTQRLYFQENQQDFIEFPTMVNAPDGVSLNEYVYGTYIRNLPTRGMLPYASMELQKRNARLAPTQRVLNSGFMGAPGTGKSYFFEVLGKMSHDKGAVIFDCSDKSLDRLFEEPDFNSQSSAEEDAIDAHLQLYNEDLVALSPETLNTLKRYTGDAYSEKDGIISIDWRAVSFAGDTPEEVKKNRRVFANVLKLLCKKEKIEVDQTVNNQLLPMRDGPLTLVLDPDSPYYGRPIILDELNRANNLDSVRDILNFFNSVNKSKTTVKGANGRELTVKRDELPKTFFLNVTGNQQTENSGSVDLDASMTSRFPEGFSLNTIPDSTNRDYADMISTHLMGVCGTMIRDALPKAQQTERHLIKVLKRLRTIGLTSEQKAQIPAWQMVNIENAPKILKMCDQLGDFFYEIRNLANFRGAYAKIRDKSGIDTVYEDYLHQRVVVDYRVIPHFFLRSEQMLNLPVAGMEASFGDDYRKELKPEEDTQEKYAKRGDKLERVVETWLRERFLPNDMALLGIDQGQAEAVYKQARKIAATYGVIPEKMNEAESVRATIASLYNVHFEDPMKAAKSAQKLITEVLRSRYSELKEEKDDDIVSLLAVQATLQALNNATEGSTKDLKTILSINEDIDNVAVKVLEDTAIVRSNINEANAQNMMTMDNFLVSSSLTGVQDNVNKLFQSAPDVISVGNLEIVLFLSAGKDNESSVNFAVKNKKKGKFLIIGDAVLPQSKEAFENKNGAYVDRTDASRAQENKQAIDELFKGENFVEDDVFDLELTLGGSGGFFDDDITIEKVLKDALMTPNKDGLSEKQMLVLTSISPKGGMQDVLQKLSQKIATKNLITNVKGGGR